MNNKRTVLVVGAGGSVPYGFPTGDELVYKICDGLGQVERALSIQDQLPPLARRLIRAGMDVDKLTSFRDRLRESLATIDVFLAHNPDFSDVGRLAIASVLTACENRNQLFDPRRNDQRIESWYRELCNALLVSVEQLQMSRLTIVTYNYDCSLREALIGAVRSRFKKDANACQNELRNVPILHVHGCLNLHSFGKEPSIDNLKRAANGILLMNDDPSSTIDFKSAISALQEADRICFIGFGYHEALLNRLELRSDWPPGTYASLNHPKKKPQIWGTAFRLGELQRKRIERYFAERLLNVDLSPSDWGAYRFFRERVPLEH